MPYCWTEEGLTTRYLSVPDPPTFLASSGKVPPKYLIAKIQTVPYLGVPFDTYLPEIKRPLLLISPRLRKLIRPLPLVALSGSRIGEF